MTRYSRDRMLASALGIAIAVGLLPIFLVHLLGSGANWQNLVAGVYVIQLGIVFLALWRAKAMPGRFWVIVVIMFGAGQALTLLSVSIDYGSVDFFDLVSAIAKTLGILMFGGSFSAVKVSPMGLNRYLVIFLFVTVFTLCYNIMINMGSFGVIATASSSYELAFSSFFGNRNQFAHFIFVSLLIHALYISINRMKFWNLLLFVCQLLSLFLTFSRGAIGATLVSVVVVLLLSLRRKPMVAFLGGAVLLLLLYQLLFGRSSQLATRLLFRADVGLAGRDNAWNYGLDVWRDGNQWLGVGSFRGVGIAADNGMSLSEFHSFFIETLVAGGLLELTFVLAIVIASWNKVRLSSLPVELRIVYHAGFAGLAVMLFIESISFFTIGFVGLLFTITFVSIPQCIGNGFSVSKEEGSKSRLYRHVVPADDYDS